MFKLEGGSGVLRIPGRISSPGADMLVAMNESDQELLTQYTRGRVESAFAELVRRHLGLVYSAALRQVRSPQFAEEVTQSVFTDLARKAGRLKPDTILTAWLYQVARRTAVDVIRREARRQKRELIATEMNTLNATDDWKRLELLLDDAMAALKDADRTAVLLRYFENKSLREVGQALGTSEDAAQKRVGRAVERLREFFAKNGVTVSSGGLAAVISAHAVQAAPAGMAVAIASAAIHCAGTGAATAPVLAAALLKKSLLPLLLAGALGTTTYLAWETANLKRALRVAQAENRTLAARALQLTKDRDAATDTLGKLRTAGGPATPDHSELLRLRGEISALRAELDAERADKEHALAESVRGHFRPRSEWADKGNATPFDTVETLLWAVAGNHLDRLDDVATPEALKGERALFPSEQPPVLEIGAVNLIYAFENRDGTRAAVVAFYREQFAAPPGGAAYSVDKACAWQLRRTAAGWRVSKMSQLRVEED